MSPRGGRPRTPRSAPATSGRSARPSKAAAAALPPVLHVRRLTANPTLFFRSPAMMFTVLVSLSVVTFLPLSDGSATERGSSNKWVDGPFVRQSRPTFIPGNCDSLQDETLWKIPLRNSRPTSRSGRRRHCRTCVALPVCHRWEEEEGKPSQRRASNHLYMICLPGFLFQVQGERSVTCERSCSEPLQELWRGIPLGNGPELKKEPHPLVRRSREGAWLARVTPTSLGLKKS